jgi:poly(3-hydroxybutyrate) depolymerase
MEPTGRASIPLVHDGRDRPARHDDPNLARLAPYEGGGHTWPGSRITLPAFMFGRTSRTFDATRLSWEFLAAHQQ